MGTRFEQLMLRAFRATPARLQVISRTEVGAHVVRVGLRTSAEIAARLTGPTSWLRLWIPGTDGTTYQRAYTALAVDPAAGTFDIDVVRHTPSGPAARWASRAEPGEQLDAALLGSEPWQVEENDSVVLCGDPASAPAIRTVLEQWVPSATGTVLLQGTAPLPALPAGVTLRPVAADQWVPTVRELATTAKARWWVAAESGVTKDIRGALRTAGVPRSAVTARAYWIHGRAMGTAAAEN
jgi:ATP-binding cassette, subfamily B, bacterial IrtA/YbtP